METMPNLSTNIICRNSRTTFNAPVILPVVFIEEEFCLQGSGFVEFGVFETGLHLLVAGSALGEFVGIA